jgi:hypothetical protein
MVVRALPRGLAQNASGRGQNAYDEFIPAPCPQRGSAVTSAKGMSVQAQAPANGQASLWVRQQAAQKAGWRLFIHEEAAQPGTKRLWPWPERL